MFMHMLHICAWIYMDTHKHVCMDTHIHTHLIYTHEPCRSWDISAGYTKIPIFTHVDGYVRYVHDYRWIYICAWIYMAIGKDVYMEIHIHMYLISWDIPTEYTYVYPYSHVHMYMSYHMCTQIYSCSHMFVYMLYTCIKTCMLQNHSYIHMHIYVYAYV